MHSADLGQFRDLLLIQGGGVREALHLEMRDSYGTAVEIPHLAKWAAGEPDDTDWLQPWFDKVRAGTKAGKVFQREPPELNSSAGCDDGKLLCC